MDFLEYPGNGVLAASDYQSRYNRRCRGAKPPLRESNLLQPRIDPSSHLFVRDGTALIRVFQPSLYHPVKSKFTYDFIIRTVIWLLLDKLSNLFFCGSHGLRLQITAQSET